MEIKSKLEVNQLEFLNFAKKNKYFLPDFYFKHLKVTKEFEENIILNYLDGSYKYILNENNIIGFYKIEKLHWDSNIFNRSMSKMTLMLTSLQSEAIQILKDEILNDIKNEKIEHVSCQVVSNNYSTIHFLEELGFRCMDNIIRFGVNLNKWISKNDYKLTSNNVIVRETFEKDHNEIIKLSKIVFNNYPSRFQNDSSFSKEESDNLYSEWTNNSLRGFADLIVVAESDEKIVGFSSVKYKEHTLGKNIVLAEGQLAGVLPSYRSKGINKSMLIQRLKLVSSRADFYEVGTQIYNYASQKTFYGCGLEPIASYFTYHNNFEL